MSSEKTVSFTLKACFLTALPWSFSESYQKTTRKWSQKWIEMVHVKSPLLTSLVKTCNQLTNQPTNPTPKSQNPKINTTNATKGVVKTKNTWSSWRDSALLSWLLQFSLWYRWKCVDSRSTCNKSVLIPEILMKYIINYDFGIWKEIERQVKQLLWSLGGGSLCRVILGHVFKAWQIWLPWLSETGPTSISENPWVDPLHVGSRVLPIDTTCCPLLILEAVTELLLLGSWHCGVIWFHTSDEACTGW